MNPSSNIVVSNSQLSPQSLAHQPDVSQHYDIVIVDDDSIILELINRNISSSNLHYQVFEYARDAAEFLMENQTQSLIVDYRMPLTNGLDFIEQLKDIPSMDTTNVFITSSVNLPKTARIKAKELGVEFVLKDKLIESGFMQELVLSKMKVG